MTSIPVKTRKCGGCGADRSEVFCDLGMQPPSNYNLKPEELSNLEEFMPLRALICTECWLAQLDYFEEASELFSDDYAYFSSFSTSWLAHASAYADMMTERFRLNGTSLVAELASNDGYLLQYFKRKGMSVLGIEPSRNVAAAAMENHGIQSEVVFFGVETARQIVAKHGRRADLIAANNVLAHVPDIIDFVSGVPILLSPEGVSTFEFPHLRSLLEKNQFDTIYHEHFSYLSLTAIRPIFQKAGLRIFDVEEISTHGGSLRVFVCHENAAYDTSPRVAKLLETEKKAGMTDIAVYRQYQEKVNKVKRDCLRFLIEAQESGKSTVGYGAPAKGNTFLNYAGIRSDLIDFVVDRSPQKQGRFLPGTRLPILAPEAINEAKPDYVMIMPWNLCDEIVEQLDHIRSWGGQFVLAIPELRIL